MASQRKDESKLKQFITGGLGGMLAAAVTHPIDSLKVRMQIQGEMAAAATATGASVQQYEHKGSLKMLKHIHDTEGIFTLYKGLSASLLRQATYTTTRFGLYDVFKDLLNPDNKPLPFHMKILVGMMAGAGGALVGNPADVIMVRMQADGKKPPEQRRNYTGVFNGLKRLTQEEGLLCLWSGWSPNLVRAMFMTAGQISSYDQSKQMMLESGYFKDNLQTHFIASTISALVASLLTSPLDVVKTRIMNSQKLIPTTSTSTTSSSSKPPVQYKGSLDCFVQTFKSEGAAAFYKGFGPYFLRLGPHTILTFIFVEQLSNIWKKTFPPTRNN